MLTAKGVVEFLHYATPFAVFFYYLIDTVIGLCTLRLGVVESRNPRATVLVLMSVVIVTYVCLQRRKHPTASRANSDRYVKKALSSANCRSEKTD